MPFFTVVIPTYNRSAFLKEALQSVLDQTFQDFEVIVIDDHSTDNTKEVVESFYDDRITYILNDRARGGAGTRNAGIFRARGEWVAFLDDDDIWLPKRLDLLFLKCRQVDEGVGLIYTGGAYYDFQKKQITSLGKTKMKGWVIYDLLCFNDIGSFSRVAIRTEILRQIGGLDERFMAHQDLDLYIRIAQQKKVDCIEETLTFLRSTQNRISTDWGKKTDGSLLFWEKHKNLIDKNPKTRHRAASKVFLFALFQGNMTALLKSFPWTVSGLLYDWPNIKWLMRKIARQLLKRSH